MNLPNNPFERLLNNLGSNIENNFANDTFEAKNSHGANPEKLAKISAVWKIAMTKLGWEKDIDLIDIITGYQASIDGQYHKDFVKIAELEHYVNTLKKSRSGNQAGFYSNSQPTETQQDIK